MFDYIFQLQWIVGILSACSVVNSVFFRVDLTYFKLLQHLLMAVKLQK